MTMNKQTVFTNNAIGTRDMHSALETSGMTWTVAKQPIFLESGAKIPNQFATVRDDNSQVLGIVGKDYTVMQTEDAFGILTDLIDADLTKKMTFATVGEIDGGRRVFASVDLNMDFDVVPGDVHKTYAMATTSFDGSKGTGLKIATVRQICTNGATMTVVHGRANVRHTQSSHERLARTRFELQNVGYTVETMKNALTTLASRQLNRKLVESILDRLFPMPAEDKTDAARTRTENRRAMFLELFERNDGDGGFSLLKGTAANAWNAFTEYTDHYEGVKQTARKDGMTIERIRAERAMFGVGATRKESALEIILEATKFAPHRDSTRAIYVPAASANGSDVLDAILSSHSNN